MSLNCRWTVTFHASTAGGRCLRGNTRGMTPFGHWNVPSEPTVTELGSGGPEARVNTEAKLFARFRF